MPHLEIAIVDRHPRGDERDIGRRNVRRLCREAEAARQLMVQESGEDPLRVGRDSRCCLPPSPRRSDHIRGTRADTNRIEPTETNQKNK